MPDLDLQEKLWLLYEHQQIDTEILALHHKSNAIPLKIGKLEERFQTHRQELQEKQEQLADAEREQRSKMSEIEMQQEQRGKYLLQLRAVKTNKEYQALDKEINFLEVKKAEIEDEILSLMLDIDQLKEEFNQQEKAFNIERAKNNKRKTQYAQKAEDLKAQITACQEKRQMSAYKIDRDLMKLYQEWFKRQQSGIVSLVVDQTCGSCHFTIPPQTIQETRKYERLIRCGSCKCIFYIPPRPPDDAPSATSSSD